SPGCWWSSVHCAHSGRPATKGAKVKRHIQHSYYVEGEGLWTFDDARRPRCISPVAPAEVRMFRFSRLGPQGEVTDPALNQELAKAMTVSKEQPDSSANGADPIPAGFGSLGQVVAHDLARDATAVSLGQDGVDKLPQVGEPGRDRIK